jgi:PAS domain S-box-containing protein
MNISLLSIRGRISLAIISILLLVLIPITYVSYQVATIYSSNQYLEKDVMQIEYFGSSLKNTLNQSFSYLSLYGLYYLDSNYQDLEYENEVIRLFEISQNTKQQLIKIEQNTPVQYSYYETKVKIKDINESFESLSEKYDLLTNTQNLKGFIYNEILPLHLKLDKLLSELIQKEQQREKVIQTRLTNKITKIVLYAVLLFIVTLIIALIFIYILLTPIFKDLILLKKYIYTFSQGSLPKTVAVKNIETQEIVQSIDSIILELKKVETFDKNMTNPPFNAKGDLGKAFANVQETVREVSKTEQIRDWQNEGIAMLGEVIRKHALNLEDLCVHFLADLVAHTSSIQAGLFIHNPETDLLELQAAFAYGKRKHIPKGKKIGEDLLTEVFKDGETLFLTDIPKDYLEIRSGLGKSYAKCVIIVPLKHQSVTIGVLEMASFDIFQPYQIEVVERVGGIFAAAADTAISNKLAKVVLDKTQKNAAKMAKREEKLRKQTEELLGKQELLESNNRKLFKLGQEQEMIFEKNVLGIIITDKAGKIQKANIATANLFGYNRENLTGVNIKKLIPELLDLNKQYKENERNRYFTDCIGVRRGREELFVQIMVNQLGQKEQEFYSLTLTRSQPSLTLKKQE